MFSENVYTIVDSLYPQCISKSNVQVMVTIKTEKPSLKRTESRILCLFMWENKLSLMRTDQHRYNMFWMCNNHVLTGRENQQCYFHWGAGGGEWVTDFGHNLNQHFFFTN